MTVVLSANPVLAYFSCSKPVTLVCGYVFITFSITNRYQSDKRGCDGTAPILTSVCLLRLAAKTKLQSVYDFLLA
ncbi:hypothetical protein DFQ01_13224 [Paenibacillus cellulosilyticus]|uniref:Uncharacterized protein n=1 Tax=Paenibacillus cellulosilyticus TaxID=375489 RepID=A0A2V2YM64_9BACL|nr:hypothetical protein DFQ01_13224 [Paenibacillus cellulosilyticus]